MTSDLSDLAESWQMGRLGREWQMRPQESAKTERALSSDQTTKLINFDMAMVGG